jgi:hypothetical protein
MMAPPAPKMIAVFPFSMATSHSETCSPNFVWSPFAGLQSETHSSSAALSWVFGTELATGWSPPRSLLNAVTAFLADTRRREHAKRVIRALPAEQARIVQLLVERIDVREDALEVRIRADGVRTLMVESRATWRTGGDNSAGQIVRQDSPCQEPLR